MRAETRWLLRLQTDCQENCQSGTHVHPGVLSPKATTGIQWDNKEFFKSIYRNKKKQWETLMSTLVQLFQWFWSYDYWNKSLKATQCYNLKSVSNISIFINIPRIPFEWESSFDWLRFFIRIRKCLKIKLNLKWCYKHPLPIWTLSEKFEGLLKVF